MDAAAFHFIHRGLPGLYAPLHPVADIQQGLLQPAQIVYDHIRIQSGHIPVEAPVVIVDPEIILVSLGPAHLVPVPVAAPGAGGLVHQGLGQDYLALDGSLLDRTRAAEAGPHDVVPLRDGRGAVRLTELIPRVEGCIRRNLVAVIGLDRYVIGIVQCHHIPGTDGLQYRFHVIHAIAHADGDAVAPDIPQKHILSCRPAGLEADVDPLQIQILPLGDLLQLNPGAAPVHQGFLPGGIHAVGIFSGLLRLPSRQMDAHHTAPKLQPVPEGVAARLRAQIAGLLPEILEILRIFLPDSGHQHRQGTVVPASRRLHEPGPGREAHEGDLPQHLRLILRQALIHIPAAPGIQGIHDLPHRMAQRPHPLYVERDGIRQGIRRPDDERAGPVPGVGILDAGNGLVASPAAAEDIAVGPAAAVILPGHLAGILRCRRAGFPDFMRFRMASEGCGGLHIGLDKVSAVLQAEGDGVVLAAPSQGGNLLVRPRERTQILIEPPPEILLHRKTEHEFRPGALKSPMYIAEGLPAPVRHVALPHLVRINVGLSIISILFRIIDHFFATHDIYLLASLRSQFPFFCLYSIRFVPSGK